MLAWLAAGASLTGDGDVCRLEVTRMSQATATKLAHHPRTYDGTLAGLVATDDGWCFEGVSYDTPADDATIVESVGQALEEPSGAEVKAMAKLMFNGSSQFTSQLLTRMAVAYELECGDDGTGVQQIKAILIEAARRIAVIEALSI